MDKSRSLAIDVVKVIAMFGVMSLHSNLGRTNTYYTAFILSRLAGISIPLFFMVSGYLYTYRKVDYSYSFKKTLKIIKFTFIITLFYWFFFCFRVEGINLRSMIYTYPGCFFQKGEMFVFWYLGAMILIYFMLPLWSKLVVTQQDIKKTLLIFFSFSTIAFLLDYYCQFEKRFIIQTFRIYYWIFYFGLGCYIHTIKEKLNHINLYIVGGSAAIMLTFVKLLNTRIGGVEYFFGSIPCIIYAALVFVYVIQYNWDNVTTIKWLSSLFLPCYAIHMTVIKYLHKFFPTDNLGELSPVVDYILVVIVTVTISSIIMRIPYVHKIFRI